MKTIYIIFDEVEILTNNFFVWPGLAGTISKYSYLDCINLNENYLRDNDREKLRLGQNITIPALFDVDRIDFFNKIKKHFEIFNLNFEIATAFPETPINTQNAGYIKIHNSIEDILNYVNNPNDQKWDPLKRLICYYKQGVGGFANYRTGYAFCQPNIQGAVHEIGHLLFLDHQGNFDLPPEFGPVKANEYSDKNIDYWIPIMGGTAELPAIETWSNSDAIDGYSLPEGVQNDIKLILDKNPVNLIKKPPIDYKWPTGPVKKLEKSSKTRKVLRYLTEEDGTQIEGMLGYPFDFDLYAILVKPGLFYAQVSPLDSDIMNACSIEILTCDCQLDLKKYGISRILGDFGDYPNYTIYHDLVYLENNSQDAKKYIFKNGEQEYAEFNLSARTSVMHSFQETALIILKVAGGYLNVDPVTKQPDKRRRGISQYGAVGKYKLQLNTLSWMPSSSSILKLKASCSEYRTCGNGRVTLFETQTLDSAGDENGLHTLKQKVITNGKIEEKNFLVYGKPIDINAPDPTFPDGSKKGLYLAVLIDDECKKQEFVVGYKMSNPDNPDFML
jgi:hypothetical protein